MSEKPAITALAPWFGSKRTLAPRIVAELGEHRAYWGICCGSMSVELAKPACSMETCIDLHGDLTNLIWCIQDTSTGSQLYRRLRRTVMSRELHQRSIDVIRSRAWTDEGPSVERAYHYFLVSWLGRNGVAGTDSYNAGFCSRYTSKGGHAGTRFQSAIDSIPAWRRRIRNIVVERRDIFDVLPRIEDASGTVIYCDPPYIEKGASYVHDFTDDDHQRLADALRRFEQTRVVVSYYDHPRLSEMYPGWTQVDCPTTKAMVNQGKRDSGGAVKAPEVLLINGPSYTQPQDSELFAESHP